jgi:hypothetical protein
VPKKYRSAADARRGAQPSDHRVSVFVFVMRDVVGVKPFIPPGCSMQEASCEDRRVQRREELQGQAAIEDVPMREAVVVELGRWLGGCLALRGIFGGSETSGRCVDL